MEKKEVMFGDLSAGDYIYKVDEFSINRLKINKISTDEYGPHSVFIEACEENNGKIISYAVGKDVKSSYKNTIFSTYNFAASYLVSICKEKLPILEDEINRLIIEHDKIEQFLDEKENSGS